MRNALPVSTRQLKAVLLDRFGLQDFRAQQEAVIKAILGAQDVFVNFSTGQGKSLCFQLPAVLMEGLSIVVSPLIALMHDQVNQLREKGIGAAYINSTLEPRERDEMFALVQDAEAKLLYLSPEQLSTEGLYQGIAEVEVAQLIVDEAHCISMWGHDFRPSYSKIAKARERLGNPPLAMFTATAPVRVRDDIIENLQAQEALQFIGPIERENLKIGIEHFDYAAQKDEWLFPRLREHTSKGEPTIVYCRKVSRVKELAEALSSYGGVHFEIYHGQLDATERAGIETKFLKGLTPILIATKAFGMGVDKSDIRNVYHYALPESLEEYWQEIGRAGRDGEPAHCLLMYMPRDTTQLRRFIASANPQLSFIKKVWKSLNGLQRYVDEEAQRLEVNFYAKGWAESFAGKDAGRVSAVIAALAQLEQYGLIELHSRSLVFLHTEDDFSDENFPIREAELQVKRDAAILRLKIMIHYAMQGREDPVSLVSGHFNHNSLVDAVEDMDLDSLYTVHSDTTRIILEALAERDFIKSEFGGYLRGTNSVNGFHYGALAHLSAREVRADIEQVANLTYLREVPVGAKTLLALALEGERYLEQRYNIVLELHTRWTEMKQRFLSTPSRRYLKGCLGSYFRDLQAVHPRSVWNKLRDFMDTEFEVLDQQLSGLQLTAQFARKRAVLSKSNRASNSRSSQKTGVQLREAKLLFEWLFDAHLDAF